MIIAFEYEDATAFHEGLAAVKKSGKWGFVNKKGKVAIDFQYDLVSRFINGICDVRQKNERFFISRKGSRYLDGKFSYESSVDEDTNDLPF